MRDVIVSQLRSGNVSYGRKALPLPSRDPSASFGACLCFLRATSLKPSCYLSNTCLSYYSERNFAYSRSISDYSESIVCGSSLSTKQYVFPYIWSAHSGESFRKYSSRSSYPQENGLHVAISSRVSSLKVHLSARNPIA